MMPLSRPTLVLNRFWQAVGVTSVRRAIVLVFQGRARILSPDTWDLHDLQSWADLGRLREGPTICSVSMALPVPEIVLLTRTGHVPRARIVFSRRNIFKRDHYTCQYCGARPRTEDLTIDHVVPRAMGGGSSWSNCVVSCRSCNERKGRHTPERVGLKLRTQPRRPDYLPFILKQTHVPASWEKFIGELYWNAELEQSD